MGRKRSAENADLPRHMHRKHGAIYLVRPLDGKLKWTRLAKTLAEAYAAMSKLMISASKGDELMMPDLIEQAFEPITKNVKPSSKQKYRVRANQLIKGLQGVSVRSFTGRQVRSLRRELEDQPGKFNSTLTVLRKCLQWGLDQEKWDLLDTDVTAGIKHLTEEPRTRYLKDAEYLAIYERGTERVQVVMELCYRTAQRIGDVLSIELTQLSDEGIFFEQEKTGNRIVVAWTPELRKAVERAQALSSNVVPITGARFLLSQRGGGRLEYDNFHNPWLEAVELSGIKDARPHDLRAKAATDIYKKFGIKVAQYLLGHEREKQTWDYVRQRIVHVVAGPTAEPAAKGRKGKKAA